MIDFVIRYWPMLAGLFNLMVACFIWSWKQSIRIEFGVILEPTRHVVMEHEKKLVQFEERLANTPTHNEITDLRQSVAVVHADYRALVAKVDGMAKQVDAASAGIQRIEYHLLRQAKA